MKLGMGVPFCVARLIFLCYIKMRILSYNTSVAGDLTYLLNIAHGVFSSEICVLQNVALS